MHLSERPEATNIGSGGGKLKTRRSRPKSWGETDLRVGTKRRCKRLGEGLSVARTINAGGGSRAGMGWGLQSDL